jgi:allene oxide cyclase-like protein
MRKMLLAGAAVALVLGVAGAIAIPAASQAAGSSPAKSTTLVFDVVFSPPEFVQANNVRDPNSPFSLGDELVFHDQLFSSGQHVGDEAGSCVIVDVSPVLANCTEVMRLPDGTITAQFLNAPPPVKQLAITGGSGVYNAAGGDGTAVEFGNGTGKVTLHLLSLVARGGSA